MPSRREALRLAELLASAPTVSYREHEVLARIRSELDRYGISYASDRWGNLLARYKGKRSRGRPVAFTAHADHPGLIVTSCRGMRAEARWMGGVQPRYFKGSKVRIETEDGPVRGRVTSFKIGPDKRVNAVRLLLDRAAPEGSIGGWDLSPFRLDEQWIRTKSADDLLGCAGVLYLMKQLALTQPPIDVWGVFTRAEEVGLLGAAALADAETLSKETAIVVLETSKELPCGRLGEGVVVRVGDRKCVYDPEISQALYDAAETLSKKHRSFSYQRCLMGGGFCEATAFQSFGYKAGGLALPLGNYHNMGKKTIGEEFVHKDDYWNLARLLPAAALKIATMKDGLSDIRRAFQKRLKKARPELEKSRALVPPLKTSRGTRRRNLVIGLIMCLFGAGAVAAAPQVIDDSSDATATKPAMPAYSATSSEVDIPDPRESYDAIHYDLKLTLDPAFERIAGELTMRLEASDPISTVVLDLGETLAVDSAACNGVTCSFDRVSSDQVEITLPTAIAAGESETLLVRYEGTPGPAFFGGFEFFTNHGQEPDDFPIVSSLSQPDRARNWWPCKDLMTDKATVSLTLTAPTGFVIAGNGNRMREEVDGDTVLTTWATSYPIATYLVSFAATNYVRWDEMYKAADGDSLPLVFFAYPEDEEEARADFAITGDALDAFENHFGPYPFRDRSIGWEKLGVAEFPWSSGAMEHQTCISYGDGFITGDNRNDWALAHEISHQWWGDSVTPTTMDDIWLNEGFATYCEALFAEWRGGVPAYRNWMRRLWKSANAEFPGTVVRPTHPFNSTVYRKGAWVLHMLRGILGDDEFFEAMNEYYSRYQYGNAGTPDFIRAVEETAGEDLRWFFYPWLYGTGRPRLIWDWWASPADGQYSVRVYMNQTQEDPDYPELIPGSNPPTHFSFPIQVRLFGASDSLNRVIMVEDRSITTVLESIPFEPDSIALDPDQWILREISPRGERVPRARVRVLPNPSTGRMQLLINNPSTGRAELTIYGLTGRQVRALPAIEGAGIHDLVWDGRSDDGRIVASGVYFLRVTSSGGEHAARIVVAR